MDCGLTKARQSRYKNWLPVSLSFPAQNLAAVWYFVQLPLLCIVYSAIYLVESKPIFWKLLQKARVLPRPVDSFSTLRGGKRFSEFKNLYISGWVRVRSSVLSEVSEANTKTVEHYRFKKNERSIAITPLFIGWQIDALRANKDADSCMRLL